MPKYNQFQYSIHKYGRYDASKNKFKNYVLLKGRIGIRKGNEIIWVYSSSPVILNGQQNKFRLKSNKNECLYTQNVYIDKVCDKIRMYDEKTHEWIYSIQGWG